MKGHVAAAACVLHPKQNQDGGKPCARPPWELQWASPSPRDSSDLPMCLVLALLIPCKFFFPNPWELCSKHQTCYPLCCSTGRFFSGSSGVNTKRTFSPFLPFQQLTCLDASLQNKYENSFRPVLKWQSNLGIGIAGPKGFFLSRRPT